MEKQFLNNGKLPPACIEIEDAVIGSMLCFKNSVDEALTIISKPEIFYKDSNKNIFTAIQSLHRVGNPIDLMTVSAELRKLGLLDISGGDFYLMELSGRMSSSAHTEYHCRLVLQKYMARQTILFSSQIIALAYDETTDIFELMGRWQKEFDNVVDFISTGRDTMSFPTALQNLKHEVELLTANKEEVKLVGVHTGFRRLNKYTGGWRNQELIIIAARPGMGKTAFILKCAIENCKSSVGVGFISLEMSMQQLTARAVAIDTNFHLNQLLKKGFEHPEYFNTYTHHQERMKEYPLYIDDSGKTDISDVVIKIKILVRKHNIKIAIIDYLQLMTDRTVKGNREAEISSISRRLKALAKELDIPVIALSQLSRAVETRGASKRPMLSDLRESGAIEQDADVVIFLYRPDYYKIDINDNIDDYEEYLQPLIRMGADSEVIIAKYRAGATSTTLLKWIGDKTKYADVECPDDMCEDVDVYEVKELPKISPADAFGTNEIESDNGIDF